MLLLAGFLEVLFRALPLIALSTAVGGLVFIRVALRPVAAPTPFRSEERRVGKECRL